MAMPENPILRNNSENCLYTLAKCRSWQVGEAREDVKSIRDRANSCCPYDGSNTMKTLCCILLVPL